ncbi:MAG: SUMF1/EgtB/PvdO family nonheme iron enzyme [Leucothrix sp.]
MTSSNGDNQDDQKQWEAVLSGERLPVKHSQSEQEADAIRQVLVWRHAKQIQSPQTPDDAAAFYEHLHKVQKQRQRASYLRWLAIGLVSAALLALIGFGLWHLLADKASQTSFTQPPKQSTTTLPKALSLIPELVEIPAGNFVMGCTAGWDDSAGGCRSNEHPPHEVNIKAFRMGRYEVTIGQFKHFVKNTGYLTVAEQDNQGCSIADPEKLGSWIVDPELNWRSPGFVQTDSHPVVCISWKDTQQYLTWLNTTTQNNYRLPTEAEWEYAARSKRVTAYHWGDEGDRRFANYQGVAAKDNWPNTAPVGLYSSNDFGLHDMAGNVWEWTASCWRENYKIPEVAAENCKGNSARRARRGGGWDNSAPSIRSAYRSSGSAGERSYLYGFRVAHDY